MTESSPEPVRPLADRVRELEAENARLTGQLDTLRREREHHRAEIERQRRAVVEVKRVLDSVAASWSFRLGRALTAPVRWLRPRR